MTQKTNQTYYKMSQLKIRIVIANDQIVIDMHRLAIVRCYIQLLLITVIYQLVLELEIIFTSQLYLD